MSQLVAFRSTAMSVLRPGRTPRPAFNAPRGIPSVGFHSTPITLLKRPPGNPDASGQRKRIFVPLHTPIPKPLRGRKIKLPLVSIRDRRTKMIGKLQRLEDVFKEYPEDKFLVELVSEEPPVVEVLNLTESRVNTLLERQYKNQTGTKVISKEIQLTWSMGEADEAHKLQKVREELEKGHRVDVVFVPKKGVTAPTFWEMQGKLAKIQTSLEDISMEWKAIRIAKPLSVIYLQSKVKASKKLDREEMKNSIPKHIQEREQRAKKQQKQANQPQNTNQPPSEADYAKLWGV
ncbi:hypothetical protein FA15DRAFT_753359 [Coprinopsis marcescibilis]|uniref:Translation initiation factor 3 N-terminal domain-containing protein n=1 Tax=Coprinopsis marcescibilis TaxID=230819 RepID=A0A5C3L7H1_COPMA|nr:hypothetical protein FA15DRAFT_753359 [Coprinopsis marcescibilis]